MLHIFEKFLVKTYLYSFLENTIEIIGNLAKVKVKTASFAFFFLDFNCSTLICDFNMDL